VVSRIQSDEVDILIDCAGLFEGARPSVLAMQAAPLQVAWLGYPSGLGLKSICCRMLDARSLPVCAASDPMPEEIALIDGCFLAYDPLADDPLPRRNSRRNAAVTFGCFNDSSKWNPVLLDHWGQLLREVEGSRLLLKTRTLECAEVREWVHTEFAARGIGMERLELRGFAEPQAVHRSMYADVDIALDTFPYHGVTSTCEALWMGVPVVTLSGESHASRVGASLLHATGHPEWIAASFDEYRGIAGSLAAGRRHLDRLHETLRGQLHGSQLFDTHGFARRFELALLRIWARRLREPDG
jgi:predicted O-linked N-acetylglucosamine transferase (SPINDLY family)